MLSSYPDQHWDLKAATQAFYYLKGLMPAPLPVTAPEVGHAAKLQRAEAVEILPPGECWVECWVAFYTGYGSVK